MKAAKNKSNPFKTPSGYLEGFEVVLPSNRHKKSNKQQTPFQVPHGYFENFSVQKEPKPSVVLPFYRKYAWVAAAAVILFLLGTPFLNLKTDTKNKAAIATAIDGYLEYATDAMTTYDMASFLDPALHTFETESAWSPSLEMYLESQIHPYETLELKPTEND